MNFILICQKQLFQLANLQRLPLTNQIPTLPVFKNGLDYSSKPDFPRPNSGINQSNQLTLSAAEDKTRLDKTLVGTVKD
jgi:hypothetical protein